MRIDTKHSTFQSQPLVPVPVRIGVAIAVAGVVAFTWVAAGRSSHEAVQTAAETISRGAPITLPAVDIVARRDSLGPSGPTKPELPQGIELSSWAR